MQPDQTPIEAPTARHEEGGFALPAAIGVLVIIACPLAVWLSTIGGGLRRNDRLFLCWMAPRGIVAASVATVFARTLVEEGADPVPELVPVVFATVIVTVALYGLTATRVARATRVAKTEPNGIALVSNHRYVVDLADVMASHDIPVLVVATSTEVQRESFSRGLFTYDRALDNHDLDLTLDGVGIKSAVLITDDENMASLAAHHLTEHLGRANLYQVPPDDDDDDFEMRGRPAFGNVTFRELSASARSGTFAIRSADELAGDERHLFHLPDDGILQVLNGPAPSTPGRTVVVVPADKLARRSTDSA